MRNSGKMGKKKTSSTPQSSVHWSVWGLPLICLGLSLLMYGRTISYEYVYDDDVYLEKNQVTSRGLSGMGDILSKGTTYGFDQQNVGTYRPITLTTFALEKSLGGFSTKMSHLINVLLYALCLWVMARVLRQLLSPQQQAIMWGVLLIFAVHPVHVEVVANVKSRDELLAFLFVWLSFGQSLKAASDPSKAALPLVLSGVFLLLGCASKENALAYVFIAPIALYVTRPTLSLKEMGKVASPLLAAALVYLGIRGLVLDDGGDATSQGVLNNAILAATSTSEQIGTQLYILGEYLRLTLIPFPLRYDYSFAQTPVVGMGHPMALLGGIGMLGIALLGIWGIFKRKLFALGVWMYLLPLAIVANVLVLIAATMAERFLFLPTAGSSLLVVLGIYTLAQKINAKKLVPIFWGLTGAITLGFSVLTWQRVPVWEDQLTLFRAGVEEAPESFRTHLNLAEDLRGKAESMPPSQAKQSLFVEAAQHYLTSLKLVPDQKRPWYNLGVCYYNLNRKPDAAKAYRNALKHEPDNALAANNLGVIYFQGNDMANAAKFFQRAIDADPNYAEPLGNLGAILHNQGKLTQAIGLYERATKLNPGNQNVRNNLARAKQQLRGN
ncbi:MAG: tetratricopeptide repeat protein [Bacteroidota bacterium]